MPHLGIFFGKKIPKNPKKPNCIGFKPSNTDSEQGCRRQPCFFARRRQHGTATAPTPRAPAVPPAPAARRAAPHSPVVHPTLTVVPSVIAPSPCTSRASQSPHRSSETADFQFFTKHFELYASACRTQERRREGTTAPAAGGYNFQKLGKQFKLCSQLAELK